jgi:hypothetical protein
MVKTINWKPDDWMLVKQEGSDSGLQESKLENYATFTKFYPEIYYLMTFVGAQWFLGHIL